MNTETACFFCSNFEESGAVQRMALFLNLVREGLPAVIVTDNQGLWHCIPLTESTIIGQGGDAHCGGERRWGDGSRDTMLP